MARCVKMSLRLRRDGGYPRLSVFRPASLVPGAVFAEDFRVVAPLAMGGMGAVYVVEQISTGRKRALKLMLPELVQNPRSRERFEQEARVASRVDSDHIVEVIGAGVEAATGAPWLAMELLEGETLSARLAREGRLAPDAVVEVISQLCHALGAAHAVGLVHRDIKPDNVYLCVPRREGVPFTLKVLDFGIAKLTEDARAAGGTTGAIGSPLWMAPEQTSSDAVTPAADVWAVGLIAFNLLTGKLYWRTANHDGGHLQALLREVVMEPLDPAGARAQELGAPATLPPGFDAWFSRAVARDPTARFPDASHALAAFTPLFGLAAAGAAAHGLATSSGSLPSLPATAHSASAAPVPRPAGKSGAGRLLLGLAVVGLLGLFLVLGASGVLWGLWESGWLDEATPTVASAASDAGAPTAEAPGAEVVAPEASGVAASAEKTPQGNTKTKPASAGTAQPGVATPTAASGATPAPSASAVASGGDVIALEADKGPARDYKSGWLHTKIQSCWKGNEGAKPDAGHFTANITVTLNKLGQTSKILVSPQTYPKFKGCAIIRTSEHPFGKGPEETKTFTINL